MRIVIDMQGAQNPGYSGRGVGRYVRELARNIVACRSGHDVLLVLNGAFPDSVTAIRAEYHGILPRENIRVWHPLEAVGALSPGSTWRRESSEQVREAFLVNLRPDIVLIGSFFEGWDCDTVTSLGKYTDRFPTAVLVHDLIPYVMDDLYLEDPVCREWYMEKFNQLNRADALLTNSESTRREVLDCLRYPEDRAFPIYGSIDGRFGPRVISLEERDAVLRASGLSRPFILYTCGDDPRKNTEGLIRAFSLIPHELRSWYQLALVGICDRHVRARYEAAIRASGLGPEDVACIGFVSDAELSILYNLCSLFVFPSWHEGFGLPVLEAMACGRAVIAGNTSSLPEVVGRQDALFDARDDTSIARKIEQVLTDPDFKRELEEHGPRQALNFSGEKMGNLAIAAMEACVEKRRATVPPASAGNGRPKLAYISPLPPDKSGISQDCADLLMELVEWYSIDVIVDQPKISPAWIREQCPMRDAAWFRGHFREYDRILYHIDNDPDFHKHMFDLLRECPGVVILHDFSVSGAKYAMATSGYLPHSWLSELYSTHGYSALARAAAKDDGNVCDEYSCSLDVLQNALGIIIHSEHSLRLARELYGEKAGDDWVVIPPSPAADCANACRSALEQLYCRADESVHAVCEAVASLPSAADAAPGEWKSLARTIARDFPPAIRQKQLFIDVSTLAKFDCYTGIQRVIKSILMELLTDPPVGCRIEPVYADIGRCYKYARAYTAGMLHSPPPWPDTPIEYAPGDCFLVLDHSPLILCDHREFLRRMRGDGVEVKFVIHDILLVLIPHHFGPGAYEEGAQWLDVVMESDGCVCVSHAVADTVREWKREHGPSGNPGFTFDAFHLGADFENSLPTRGMPDGAERPLASMQSLPTFLMVGTIEPRKGHRLVLDACEILWSQGVGVNLAIVGKRGWLMDDFFPRLDQHPENQRRLFWLESISDEYLERVYAASSCLVFASEAEGFGLPLIEAARNKLPILARDIPVFREVAGPHATFFSGNSPQSLALAMRNWLDDFRQDRHVRSDNMPWLTWKESTDNLVRALGMERRRA